MNVLCGKAVFIRAYNSNSSVPRGVSFRNCYDINTDAIMRKSNFT